ncbi:Uncharacterised protein [Listeria grayi]|uniref:Maltose-binding periplasmic proteins/domains n=1 Tax=Listeria grayi TaxID=1641 RepID=A0A378MJB2_LISGR|nr:hypothetical protein [Listeria grayi]STY45576.1 Uncharacterised protein [Listeria grayi]
MWKKLVTVVLVLMVVSLAACSSGGSSTGSGKKDTKKDKGLDPIGQTVKYDPNHLVNKGEPIDIEYWTWVDNDPAIALAKNMKKHIQMSRSKQLSSLGMISGRSCH